MKSLSTGFKAIDITIIWSIAVIIYVIWLYIAFKLLFELPSWGGVENWSEVITICSKAIELEGWYSFCKQFSLPILSSVFALIALVSGGWLTIRLKPVKAILYMSVPLGSLFVINAYFLRLI